MALSPAPKSEMGAPIYFFDSHPAEQSTSYIASSFSYLKSQLHIAFTGEVPRPHEPGYLRIIWYTTDGNKGMKDYQLHEYEQVRENFDELLKMDEIRRVVIMGYPTENPYIIVPGGKKNPLAKRLDKKMQQVREDREEVKKTIDKNKALSGLENADELMDEEEEEEERREFEERSWKDGEGEGLLGGR